MDGEGRPLSGAIIMANKHIVAITDVAGYYSITGMIKGTYEITVALNDYIFHSAVEMPLLLPPSRINVDFVGTITQTYSISGFVKDLSGKPMAGVAVVHGLEQEQSVEANVENIVVTDRLGNYVIRDLYPGKYVVSLTMRGYSFTPAKRIVSVPPDAVAQDFVGLRAVSISYTLSGRVTDVNANPISGVTILLGDRFSAITDRNGVYSLRAVPQGTYTITATRRGYTFTPSYRIVNVPRDLTGQDFRGIWMP